MQQLWLVAKATEQTSLSCWLVSHVEPVVSALCVMMSTDWTVVVSTSSTLGFYVKTQTIERQCAKKGKELVVPSRRRDG